MKKPYIVLLAGLCVLLCSCASAPKAVARTIVDLDTNSSADKVIIVSDAGKQFGKTFGAAFSETLTSLMQNSDRDVSLMSFIDYIRSSYNDPDKKSSFPNTLFVFIQSQSTESDGYGVSGVKYRMDVQYLDQEPLMYQEIQIRVLSSIWSSKSEPGVELAETVFNQLQRRNLL